MAEVAQQSPAAPKTVVKRIVRMEGDSENCGHCKLEKQIMTEKANGNPKLDYMYMHVPITDPKPYKSVITGEEVEAVPITEVCDIMDDGSKECRVIKGFAQADFANIDQF